LGILMPSALTRRLSVAAAALPMTAGALLAGALPALAGTSTGGAPTPAVAPGGLAPISHPDADHMGSTIRAHQQVATSPLTVTPRMLALTSGAQPLGMDVSSLQGNVDWATAAANGAKFVYIKSTEATGYVNPYLVSQYTGSYAAGVIRGTYHFALPDRSTGAAQASYFLAHLGGWSPDGKTLPPMLDMEYNPYGATCYGQSPGSWPRGSPTSQARSTPPPAATRPPTPPPTGGPTAWATTAASVRPTRCSWPTTPPPPA